MCCKLLLMPTTHTDHSFLNSGTVCVTLIILGQGPLQRAFTFLAQNTSYTSKPLLWFLASHQALTTEHTSCCLCGLYLLHIQSRFRLPNNTLNEFLNVKTLNMSPFLYAGHCGGVVRSVFREPKFHHWSSVQLRHLYIIIVSLLLSEFGPQFTNPLLFSQLLKVNLHPQWCGGTSCTQRSAAGVALVSFTIVDLHITVHVWLWGPCFLCYPLSSSMLVTVAVHLLHTSSGLRHRVRYHFMCGVLLCKMQTRVM